LWFTISLTNMSGIENVTRRPAMSVAATSKRTSWSAATIGQNAIRFVMDTFWPFTTTVPRIGLPGRASPCSSPTPARRGSG
jgi:hypothetical protein